MVKLIEIKNSLKTNQINLEDVVQYKHQLMGLFQKVYDVMLVNNSQIQNEQWMQAKLYSTQLQPSVLSQYSNCGFSNLNGNMYLSNCLQPFHSFNNVSQNTYNSKSYFNTGSLPSYDSSLLEGEVCKAIQSKDKQKLSPRLSIKIKERKSSFSST